MAIWIQRPRPMRSAASLPRMDEGTAARFTTAAIAARFQGNSTPGACRPAEYARKATIQAREPNSSMQCAA